jgi:hypothetical protein
VALRGRKRVGGELLLDKAGALGREGEAPEPKAAPQAREELSVGREAPQVQAETVETVEIRGPVGIRVREGPEREEPVRAAMPVRVALEQEVLARAATQVRAATRGPAAMPEREGPEREGPGREALARGAVARGAPLEPIFAGTARLILERSAMAQLWGIRPVLPRWARVTTFQRPRASRAPRIASSI